ncbi:hypothetical protein [Pseudomonas putida]|uniref:hypothetical protein n=1 Tax=Pseudomonas putida TaxID=303 RepID=UPI000369813B|nr:hypothetical protein [Pseudomonas putida]
MHKQYRIDGLGRGQSPISGSVKRRQILASGLGDYAELVVRYRLEKRLGEQAQTLYLLRRRASILRLVIFPHGVDRLLNQRLACLNHPDESPLIHS